MDCEGGNANTEMDTVHTSISMTTFTCALLSCDAFAGFLRRMRTSVSIMELIGERENEFFSSKNRDECAAGLDDCGHRLCVSPFLVWDLHWSVVIVIFVWSNDECVVCYANLHGTGRSLTGRCVHLKLIFGTFSCLFTDRGNNICSPQRFSGLS